MASFIVAWCQTREEEEEKKMKKIYVEEKKREKYRTKYVVFEKK